MSFYNNSPANEAPLSDSEEEVYYTAPNSPISTTDEFGTWGIGISPRSLSDVLELYLSANTQSEQERAGVESMSSFPRVKKVRFSPDISIIPHYVIERKRERRREREKKIYYHNNKHRKKMEYEVYIEDHLEVDDLVIKEEDEKNIPYTKAWHHMKRLNFFQSVGVGHALACIECRVQLEEINNTTVVKKRRRGPLCEWCERLFVRFGSLDQEIEILHYLLYGELAPHEMAVVNSFANQMLPMTEKRRKMKQLAKRKNKLTSMDPDESLQISDWRCALTNAPVFDTKKGDTKYWRISIDHIIPRSEAGNTSVSVTAIENIQIVSHIMNMIKQSFANEEVIEWWGRFRENQMKP